MLSNIRQLRINVALTERPAWIGSIVVLVARIRRLKALQTIAPRVHCLASLFAQVGNRLLSFMSLALFKYVNCTAVFALERTGSGWRSAF